MDETQENGQGSRRKGRTKWPRTAKWTAWGLAGFTLFLLAVIGSDPEALSAQEAAREAREKAEAQFADAEDQAYEDGYKDGYKDGHTDGVDEAAGDSYDKGFEEGKEEAEKAAAKKAENELSDLDLSNADVSGMFEKVFWKNWESMSADEQEAVCFGIEFMPETSMDKFVEGWESTAAGEGFPVDRAQALALFEEACGL